MAITRQLYQLQEIDLEIESEELALRQKTGQLGERQALERAQGDLVSGQKHLEELRKQQHSSEWELDDLTGKIKDAEQQLYGGRINNPKELSNLQHEINNLKSIRDQKETRILEIIDAVEAAEKSVARLTADFKKLEDEWKSHQKQLSGDIEKLQSSLADLRQKRQQLSGEIEPGALALYEKIKKQKRPPVARVERGICHGCRISLPVSELQRARSGAVQCGSCGRILFLP